MKHFVEIGIPMLDLLYGHLRQANVRIEPDSSIFDGPAGAYITTDLINVLAAEWIKSEREKNKKVFVSLDDIELEITSWKDYVDRCILRTGEKPIISKVDIFDIPRMSKNYDYKILIDTMKKYMEDSEEVVNSPAFKSLKDGVAKLVHDSVIGVSVFAKIIDPEDKKPYKEEVKTEKPGTWLKRDDTGFVFCVDGISNDCYVDKSGTKYHPVFCSRIEQPKYKKGDKLIAKSSNEQSPEYVFTVTEVSYDNSCSQFRYAGRIDDGPSISARESLCLLYFDDKPKFQKGDWVTPYYGTMFPVEDIRIDELGANPLYIYRNKFTDNWYQESRLDKFSFKKGDYYYAESSSGNSFVGIHDGGISLTSNLASFAINLNEIYPYAGTDAQNPQIILIRYASSKETSLLDSRLEKEGKRFDKEKCEIVDIPKQPKYSKGTMLFIPIQKRLGLVETIEYRPNIKEYIYVVRTAIGGYTMDKESSFVEYIPKPAVIGKPAIFWNKIKSEALCGVLVQIYNDNFTPNRKLYFENASLLESLEQYELFVKQ